jgi:hypothetical protein
MGLAAAVPGFCDEEGARSAALLRDVAPSIVTVKVLSKTTVQSGGKNEERESRVELPGLVVDAGGLVLTSILPFAPEYLVKLLAGGGSRTPHITTVPSDIEVLFEQDGKEYGAFLAATDSKLGIAFLQIESLGGRTPHAVDFSRPVTLAVGDLVGTVSRLSRTYDSAPYVQTARVGGEIAKPRQAWGLDDGISGVGQPIFLLATGHAVGLLALVGAESADADSTGESSLARGINMITSGRPALRPYVVPAPVIAGVIDQARHQAAQKAKERAAAAATPKAAEPADKPPAEAPPAGQTPPAPPAGEKPPPTS